MAQATKATPKIAGADNMPFAANAPATISVGTTGIGSTHLLNEYVREYQREAILGDQANHSASSPGIAKAQIPLKAGRGASLATAFCWASQ